MEKHLHIVSFDVPYPPDYGGVMEVFYKIKALHALGIHIHLHCFDYGRGQQNELDKYCQAVHYYQRDTGLKGLSMSIPYIVGSRANVDLLSNLENDNHPILFEGIHTTYFLSLKKLRARKILIRLHNVEYQYYHQLSVQCRNPLKKLFFLRESFLLKKYEHQLTNSGALILSISEKDAAIYSSEFATNNVMVLPAFTGWEFPQCQEGSGTFCLYHGNLSVAENENVAAWLLKEVFSEVDLPFVIAGKNPSKKLKKMAHEANHTCIVENPTETEMEDLIKKAQINILPSFTNSGIKFKLLHAVFFGRHCIVNEAMVGGTRLDSTCHIATSKKEFKTLVCQLFKIPFDSKHIQQRQQLMQQNFNNKRSAEHLMQLLN